MRRSENDRKNNRFLQKSGEFDPLGSKSGSSPAFNIASAAPCGGLVLMSSLMLTMIKLITTGEIYGCKHCETHLALAENIVSKSFHSRHGKAYLFSKVVNVTYGKMETRMMMTGMHTVADIFCVCCGSIVGWKYETAHERSQKYKEGKSVLERFKLSGPDGSHYWASHETHVAGSDADDV